jgi:hypothetical protein
VALIFRQDCGQRGVSRSRGAMAARNAIACRRRVHDHPAGQGHRLEAGKCVLPSGRRQGCCARTAAARSRHLGRVRQTVPVSEKERVEKIKLDQSERDGLAADAREAKFVSAALASLSGKGRSKVND